MLHSYVAAAALALLWLLGTVHRPCGLAPPLLTTALQSGNMLRAAVEDGKGKFEYFGPLFVFE